jgi:hypothetical protein
VQSDTRRYLAAAALLFIGAGLTYGARSLRGADAGYKPDFANVPLQIGGYTGTRLPRDESIYKLLSAGGMEERAYTKGQRSVQVTFIYGADWRAIHAPTGCYPAQGWQILHNRVVELPAPPDCPHPGPLEARLLDVTKADARELALYVYARPGATTADWTLQGLKVATDPTGSGGLIVTLRTRVGEQGAEAAQKDLADLLCAVYPRAVSFWYQGKSA